MKLSAHRRNPLFLAPGISRREMLCRAGNGFGALALSALFGTSAPSLLAAGADPTKGSLAPKPPHFPARAQSVIFLFMEGAVSQVDSFDYKPMLAKYHGQDPRQTIGKLERTQFENVGQVLKSPWNFRQHGQGGTWISDLFPHVAGARR